MKVHVCKVKKRLNKFNCQGWRATIKTLYMEVRLKFYKEKAKAM